MAFNELWESRRICLELNDLRSKSKLAEKGVSQYGNRMPTVQSSPESNDPVGVPAGDPLRSNPETQCTDDQGHDLNAHGGSVPKIVCDQGHNLNAHRSTIPKIVCKQCTDSQGSNLNGSRIGYGPWYLEHGFYIEMGGYELVAEPGKEIDLPSGFKGRVTPMGAIALAQEGLLPYMPRAWINDMSKSDLITKILVCIQASWMIIQCIARVTHSLPLTLLELHTMIQAIYAFIMSCLWFKKPYNVVLTTEIVVDDEKLKILRKIVGDNADSPGFELTESSVGLAVTLSPSQISQPKQMSIFLRAISLLPMIIYPGAHLTVWNGHFASNLERILWIASALSVVGFTFLFLLTTLLIQLVMEQFAGESNGAWNSKIYRTEVQRHKAFRGYMKDHKTSRWYVPYRLLFILWVICGFFVMIPRLYLVLEAFGFSSHNLPLGSYTTVTWASYIPHF